jgi:hypothetical protein
MSNDEITDSVVSMLGSCFAILIVSAFVHSWFVVNR